MEFVDAVKKCFRKQFELKSRATRSEYWYFVLATTVGLTPLQMASVSAKSGIYGVVYLVALLLVMPAYFSVTVRRLHDLNYSAWVLLWYFLLCYALIMLASNLAVLSISLEVQTYLVVILYLSVVGLYLTAIYFLAKRGTVGSNKYGPDPLSELED